MRHSEHCIHLGDCGADMVDELLTCTSWHDGSSGPLEQRNAEQLLKPADLNGKRRLADLARISGAAKMFMLGYGKQVAEVANVHLVSIAAIIVSIYRTN